MPTVNVPHVGDVSNDAQLFEYIKRHRLMINWLAMEYALGAGSLAAMLKEHDKQSGNRGRARRTTRPLRLAAGVLVIVAKYLTILSARFQAEYAAEIAAARRPARTARRMTFGG